MPGNLVRIVENYLNNSWIEAELFFGSAWQIILGFRRVRFVDWQYKLLHNLVDYPHDIHWCCAALRWPLRCVDDKDDKDNIWIELTWFFLAVLRRRQSIYNVQSLQSVTHSSIWNALRLILYNFEILKLVIWWKFSVSVLGRWQWKQSKNSPIEEYGIVQSLGGRNDDLHSHPSLWNYDLILFYISNKIALQLK